MSALTELEKVQTTTGNVAVAEPAPAPERRAPEVSPLAPEAPRRTREETARLATAAVRAAQQARHGWTWAVRSWLRSLFGRLWR